MAYEISHSNPLWIATPDAQRYGVDGRLAKVRTQIGYFVTRAGHGRHPPGVPVCHIISAAGG